ncbi:MAG TPA: pyridoxamine 5'-phosphate oxidase family protein [Thermosynechococcaceae cyanobacterium]
MAKVFDRITEELQSFIAVQPMFFVATAPLTSTGRVNVSPKGCDSFRVLGDNHVAYLDLTGSGNETSPHLQENGRITLMFCAFQEPPLILRLYGQGRTVLPKDPEWEELITLFPPTPGTRQIIVAHIDRVQTSCGLGVPLFESVGQRDRLVAWAAKKGEPGLIDYRRLKNYTSIDGLPAPLAEPLEQTSEQNL